MNGTNSKSMTIAVLLAAMLIPNLALAQSFKKIVVFGASLSDPGNAFALTGQAINPPHRELDDFLVPSSPYVIGGHHFSNGATWIEQFAQQIGQNQDAGPAFDEAQNKAMNYAVGGARARDDDLNLNFSQQVTTFLTDVDYGAPADALYVIDIGGNDVRDALVSGSAEQAEVILGAALNSIATQLSTLHLFGARNFLILNTPNIGFLPSIQILNSLFPGAAVIGDQLAQGFNLYLDAIADSLAAVPGTVAARLDVYDKLNQIIANPGAFGLTDATASCLTPGEPSTICPNPDRYFFWDGVHPTKAGHEVFAREAATVAISTFGAARLVK